MQAKELQPLSLLDVLTRNLLLLSVLFICLGIGIAVHFLNKYSLDCYFFKLESRQLDFIFFIIVAACYVSLLFVLMKTYWLNFLVQLLVAVTLFVVLLFVFNPIFRLNIYLFDYHAVLATRSWSKVKALPISHIASFKWLQLPAEQDNLFPQGVVCPAGESRYFLNFTFTSYYRLPSKNYR